MQVVSVRHCQRRSRTLSTNHPYKEAALSASTAPNALLAIPCARSVCFPPTCLILYAFTDYASLILIASGLATIEDRCLSLDNPNCSQHCLPIRTPSRGAVSSMRQLQTLRPKASHQLGTLHLLEPNSITLGTGKRNSLPASLKQAQISFCRHQVFRCPERSFSRQVAKLSK